jgi:phosphopantothenoylcysteine decarboxylase/phosphopantothenate--cysteine ligase
MIKNKHILIGVSGSIAAYKIPLLVRLLKKSGAEVKVVLTPSAKDFVTPVTLSTLSENPVYSDFVLNDEGEWSNHVDLALWADLILIAPASANTLAKMEQGICDNLLLAIYLSAKSPIAIAPAMDLDMYKHETTQQHLKKLSHRGHLIIPVNSGFLASGLEGEGRMAEPQEIYHFIESYFSENLPFNGLKALVTAGPTHEAIDPVRFIGNHSSGKMGIALAIALSEKGAEVTLVKGPMALDVYQLNHDYNINVIDVVSSDEMFIEVIKYWETSDIAIMAAAVADYKPKNIAQEKIKKLETDFTLALVKTKDILKSMGETKKLNQYLVGFALETENELANAKSKLNRKNLDAIVLNSMKDEGAGFGFDTNKVTIINKDTTKVNLPLLTKSETAKEIVNYISQQFFKK